MKGDEVSWKYSQDLKCSYEPDCRRYWSGKFVPIKQSFGSNQWKNIVHEWNSCDGRERKREGQHAYMCMSIISELNSSGGTTPDNWFLLKWLHLHKK